MMSCSHSTGDGDMVVELALRAELPQKGLPLRGTEP